MHTHTLAYTLTHTHKKTILKNRGDSFDNYWWELNGNNNRKQHSLEKLDKYSNSCSRYGGKLFMWVVVIVVVNRKIKKRNTDNKK